MSWTKTAYFLSFLAGTVGCVAPLAAQDVTAEFLKHPSRDSWPGFHGDYTGQRHSALTEITPQNVSNLTLSWTFQTGQNGSVKATPILVDGVLYFTTPDNIWAIDVRSGHQLWHYTAPPNKAFHIGQRGVSILKDKIYYMSSDAHLLALNAADGKVLWDVVVADSNKGQWATMSPRASRHASLRMAPMLRAGAPVAM